MLPLRIFMAIPAANDVQPQLSFFFSSQLPFLPVRRPFDCALRRQFDKFASHKLKMLVANELRLSVFAAVDSITPRSFAYAQCEPMRACDRRQFRGRQFDGSRDKSRNRVGSPGDRAGSLSRASLTLSPYKMTHRIENTPSMVN